MPSTSPWRMGAATAALVLLGPVAWRVVHLTRAISSGTSSHTALWRPLHHEEAPESANGLSKDSLLRPAKDPESLPALAKSPQYVVACERVVSRPIPLACLAVLDRMPPSTAADGRTGPSALLQRYMRATHVAFSWTPQAWLIRAIVGDARARQSFGSGWIDALAFTPGDVVNGVYVVACHERGPVATDNALPERVELQMEPPSTFMGPSVRGLLVAAIEPLPCDGADQERVVFVNETWMWRRACEKPVLLETLLGKWFHGLLARWLVYKGLDAVVAGS